MTIVAERQSGKVTEPDHTANIYLDGSIMGILSPDTFSRIWRRVTMARNVLYL